MESGRIKPYKRILLKVSGEAFLNRQNGAHPTDAHGIDPLALKNLAEKLCLLHQKGYEVAVVTGGGNIFRGLPRKESLGIARSPADQMGMLATLLNGIALKESLLHLGVPTVMMSALECPAVAEGYQWNRALELLKTGHILLFVGGTGHPYFTTDTAAALRASEIQADILLKGTTRVEGIYDQDPQLIKEAKKFDRISYGEVIERKLGIMDLTAITLCMVNEVPIKVFNFFTQDLLDALSNEKNIGTLVSSKRN